MQAKEYHSNYSRPKKAAIPTEVRIVILQQPTQYLIQLKDPTEVTRENIYEATSTTLIVSSLQAVTQILAAASSGSLAEALAKTLGIERNSTKPVSHRQRNQIIELSLAEIQQATQKFLASGGKIQRIAAGGAPALKKVPAKLTLEELFSKLKTGTKT